MRVFSYWTDGFRGANTWKPQLGVDQWTARMPDYRLFSDADVVPLLSLWGKEAARLFEEIRIPACRSDVARLVLLREFGGLYVDMHCAPGDCNKLSLVFDKLASCDLVIFDESFYSTIDRHTAILNGVLAARPATEILDQLISAALVNLAAHRSAENAAGQAHVAYDIYKLTGPWMIWHELFRRTENGGELRPEYSDRVTLWPIDGDCEDQPVLTDRHNGYRRGDDHCTARQKTECLFGEPQP
jgi:mannosyltransferase OCH1-like enzyme